MYILVSFLNRCANYGTILSNTCFYINEIVQRFYFLQVHLEIMFLTLNEAFFNINNKLNNTIDI